MSLIRVSGVVSWTKVKQSVAKIGMEYDAEATAYDSGPFFDKAYAVMLDSAANILREVGRVARDNHLHKNRRSTDYARFLYAAERLIRTAKDVREIGERVAKQAVLNGLR